MRRYYKITPSCEKDNTLKRFLHSCQKAEEAAEDYAKKFGAVAYHTHPSALAGGIAYMEFANTPDERTWRKVNVLDGQDCYEPNVIQFEGVMIAKSKFRPSDTSKKVFSKLPRTWNQVRPLKTLQEWAKMIGYTMTDDQEADAKFVHGQLKDCKFWHFIEFAGMVGNVNANHNPNANNNKRKNKREPLCVKRAITAAVEAQKLPVIFPDSLYQIVNSNDNPNANLNPNANDNLNANDNEEPSTPQFFYWESRGDWYVALDLDIVCDDTEVITEQTFSFAMATALRESEQEPVSCLED